MLTPRLFHARSTLQMVMVVRHDHHAHRVGVATLSGCSQHSRTDEVLQICRMQDGPYALRAEQDHVALNQWQSRSMTCGSAGRATSGARRTGGATSCFSRQ
jgi:hypothetical protein